MDSSLQKELLAVRSLIAKSKPITPSAGLSNGLHNCMPNSITINRAGKNKDGRLQVVISWECVEGSDKDVKQLDYNGLDDASIGYTKGKLMTMISDLPKDVLKWQEAFDSFCQDNTDVFEINVTTNEKGYKNTYLRGLASSKSGNENLEEVESESEESEEKENIFGEEEIEELEELEEEDQKKTTKKEMQKKKK